MLSVKFNCLDQLRALKEFFRPAAILLRPLLPHSLTQQVFNSTKCCIRIKPIRVSRQKCLVLSRSLALRIIALRNDFLHCSLVKQIDVSCKSGNSRVRRTIFIGWTDRQNLPILLARFSEKIDELGDLATNNTELLTWRNCGVLIGR